MASLLFAPLPRAVPVCLDIASHERMRRCIFAELSSNKQTSKTDARAHPAVQSRLLSRRPLAVVRPVPRYGAQLIRSGERGRGIWHSSGEVLHLYLPHELIADIAQEAGRTPISSIRDLLLIRDFGRSPLRCWKESARTIASRGSISTRSASFAASSCCAAGRRRMRARTTGQSCLTRFKVAQIS